jgi:hypothetical protein
MTTKAVVLILTGVGLALAQPRISQIEESYSSIGANREKMEEEKIAARIETEKLNSESDRAIAIFKAGCPLLRDEDDKPTVFTAKTQAWNRIPTPGAKTKSTLLNEGTIVCNELGETAVVSKDGYLNQVARVGTKHKAEFLKLKKTLIQK